MKYHLRVFLITTLSVLLLLLLNSKVTACSCSISPTVDIVYNQTKNIAIFKVEGVEETTEGGKQMAKSATLVVEKVFKGNFKPGDRVTFSNVLNFGICIFRFQKESIGKQYLLYLEDRESPDEMLVARLCTRSRRLSAAADDVLYLEKRKEVVGKTRLSGTVSQQVEYGSKPREWDYISLAGLSLRIQGKGKDVTLRTDENGAYEIYGLPPGKYQITLPEIRGYNENYPFAPNEPRIVSIFPRKHTSESFYYEVSNSVSGTLIDSQGQPIEGSCLDLVPIFHTLADYNKESSCTDIKGEFTVSSIISGTYILVGNKENNLTYRNPFPLFYYSNVSDVSKMVSLTLAPGVNINGLVMTAPPFSGFKTLNGVMRFSDGSPVAKASVEFYSGISSPTELKSSLSYSSFAETDENGAFRIRVMSGDKGILIGSFTARKGEYKNCPQIDKILGEYDASSDDIETPAITIDVKNGDGVVELKYPFASCQKRKK